ncbi:hypothetical protein LguiA_026546 [Lonicera macranthoides]
MENTLCGAISKLQKCCSSRNFFSADRISQLPDDILVIILSHLTLKEAVRTDILSRRWRKLWTFTTGSLDFDGSGGLWLIKVCEDDEFLEPERADYVSWVNQILRSHQGATINTFKLHFDLDLSYRSDVDSWIKFAIQKRVQRLEVNLERVFVTSKNCYLFPSQYLDNSKLSGLVSLNLNFVDVTEEVVEYFLSNCPFLEVLRITSSPSLLSAKVIATSQRLKCLEILHCHHMKYLEISALNLTSLTFSGEMDATLCFKSVPNLASLSLGGFYCGYIYENFHRLSISFSQIDKLRLDLSTEMFVNFREFPELKNVKELVLIVVVRSDQHTLLSCTSLLKACPLLYRFSIRFKWLREPEAREAEKRKGPLLKSLKEVELLHFRGSTTDVEIATFLFSNAPSLEKIGVETRNPYWVGTPREAWAEENVTAKECARQLVAQLSPGAKLQVL